MFVVVVWVLVCLGDWTGCVCGLTCDVSLVCGCCIGWGCVGAGELGYDFFYFVIGFVCGCEFFCFWIDCIGFVCAVVGVTTVSC